ncbi:putative rhomboid protein Cabca RBL13 [Paratrimastix pyriformis]|uniref:Rhomboid protein Cabca RBL13 n=1 Tax=Paratrimastix pyriformis TaxID=342808 RepID=A0ABQ8UJY5_9EUKA|nr:putative rhomboid protein Cabca RBL13 [Paratrimastix pyriformis]
MRDASIFVTLLQIPVTSCIIGILAVTAILLWWQGITIDRIGLNHSRVFRHREWWRAGIATFSHLSIIHLIFNCATVYSYQHLERALGARIYLRDHLVLVMGTPILILLVQHAVKHFSVPHYNDYFVDTYAIGFSSVAFGMMMRSALLMARQQITYLFFRLPAPTAPFLSLMLSSVLIPQSSFLGHLVGIIMGCLLSIPFVSDALSLYWTLCATILALFLVISSLGETAPRGFRWWNREESSLPHQEGRRRPLPPPPLLQPPPLHHPPPSVPLAPPSISRGPLPPFLVGDRLPSLGANPPAQ